MPTHRPSIALLLLHLLLQVMHQPCQAFQLTTPLSKFKQINFLIAPIQETLGSTLSIEVYYTKQATGGSTTLVSIYSSTIVQTDQILKYSICNFQNSDQYITIDISSPNITNLTSNIVTIGQMRNRSLFTAAFDKDTSGGYMLPFNMFNQKILQLYVIAYNASLQHMTYNLQPFMSTYWTEIQSNIEILPHLPYLSQCTYQKSFILISDLIKPLSCHLDDFYGVLCEDKIVQFNCIIEELEVSNVDAQFWFNKNKQILYFLFQNEIPLDSLYQMGQDLNSIERLILHQYENLVPVIYHRLSTDKIIVNEFHIQFQVALSGDFGMSIWSAGIKGYYNNAIAPPNALVHTHITYLNFYQRFNSYALGIQWYIGYAVLINVVFIFFIWLGTSKFCKINMRQKIDHILTPAVKGCLYTLLTGGMFFFMINQIAYQSSFNGITALYGDTLSNQLLQMNNIGRNGLAVAFIGFYLLIVSLKQAFNVSKNEDLKIVFEDHLKFQNKEPLSQQQLQEKVKFTKKNMVSHKKFLLLTSLVVIFLGFFYISITFTLCSFQLALLSIFIIPITSKILTQQLKYLIIKELLYVSGHLLSLVLTFSLITFKSTGVVQFTYLYICRYFNLYVELYLIEIFFEWTIKKIDASSQENRVYKFLSKIFKTIIEFKRNESDYERAMYLSAIIIVQTLGVLLRPIIYATFYLIQRNKIFIFGLLIDETALVISIIMMLLLIPLEIYTIFAIVQILKKETGFRIEEVIKFNRFKFRRRKFRWMNDQFSQSKNIHFFYREYQKFSFSSQLYFVISLLGYSIFLIYIGLLVIFQSSYLFMSDPASLIILTIVIIVGDTLSVFASIIALKLKLYDQETEQIMRQSLIKTQKYLKNNDVTEYLQQEDVKNHFLFYKKDWIIQNLHKIFQKEDFEENNGELITKYKHYKSISKKRQIEKKQQIKKQKENSIINNNPQRQAKNEITFNKKEFNLLIRPVMYYWFYLAKQNIFLKNIINCVKKEKIKKNCEFCNMDIELQALQRKDFQGLVNEFRLLNVKKSFDSQSFLEFYRLNQKYVTICIECKQKNLHLENKITLKQISSKLMKRWLLIAKSNILHKNASK